jgi:dTDP-4-amino-4,6-dideoxygalactose transaminase
MKFAEDAYTLADQLAAEVLSLPVGPQLQDDQVDHVVRIIEDWSLDKSRLADSAMGS